jgi:replicative DNA helicase
MFIHRDDKNSENNERTNLAEILVEKHRNGPVGKIDLYFDAKKTSYLSIDKSHEAESESVGGMAGADEEW